MAQAVIATPHQGSLSFGFVESLLKTLQQDWAAGGGRFDFVANAGIYLAQQRDELVRHALLTEARWVLFVDSDVGWEPADVRALFESADPELHPVVSGLCFTDRGGAFGPAVWDEWADDAGPTIAGYLEGWSDGGMRQVKGAGTGFLLVHRGVLERMIDLYGCAFEHVRIPDVGFVGEDVLFSWRLGILGIPVHANCDVRVRHYKTACLDPGLIERVEEMTGRA